MAGGRAVPGAIIARSCSIGWAGGCRRRQRGDRKQLDGFLVARALEHDAPGVLFQLACDWLRSEQIFRLSLNKGESLHALRRDLFFAHQGHVRRRHLDDQVDQALCLTLVTNAVVLWNTTYLGDALDALRAAGHAVTDETAAHLTPAQHDHINFYGTYSFDLETELRRDGHRPLRSPAA